MRLYHGTTDTAAERIVREGWSPLDPEDTVRSLAAEHGVDEGAVWADLRARNRFLAESTRGSVVSFATSRHAAEVWASRAPEAHWETLWSIWRVTNPQICDTPEGFGWAAWVTTQMLHTQPAVVEIEISRDDLHACGAQIGGFGLRPLPQSWPDEFVAGLPEVAVPLPVSRARIVGVQLCSRWVDAPLGISMLGIPPMEFKALAEGGSFGETRSDYGRLIWAWERLAPHRARPVAATS